MQNIKFEKEIAIILQALPEDSNMLNVIEVLGSTPENYQNAFDVALEMDNRNLVKLLYSNFNAGKVIVEFTLLAKK